MTTTPTTAVPWPASAEPAAAAEAPSTDAPRARALDTETRRATRPRWERPAVVGLLVATAVLYLWDLSASSWANSFYSAAVQAGSQSWTAFLYGASDAAGSITVDKPPASLWVMALSVRLFGLSSWAILAPQALMGVASVGALYASVRRQLSAGAALLAGAVLALTPVAALMFRFNNPDALLVLLLVLATAATVRAVEPSTRRRAGWMALAGALVGFAFLTKQLQAFLVLPGLAAAYLWAAPVPLRRRVRDGFIAVAAMVLAGGWWVALVELVPASARPYIGGSQTNSFLELTFGYNGFGRLTGDETGSVGGGGQSGGWGATGITRMFGSDIGGQIAWLIPAALVLGVVGLWLRRRYARTDVVRAALVVWGAWLVVTMLTFSLMAGIFHAYYTVALAPAIAALVGIGADLVWARRDQPWALGLLAGVTLLTGAWSYVLLARSTTWLPWLRWVVLVVAFAGAATLLAGRWYGRGTLRAGLALALVAGLAGPTAFTLQTVSTGHSGSIVTAGPGVTGTSGGFPGGRGGGFGGPGGGLPGPGTGTQAGGLGFGGGAMGGLLNGSEASAALTALLLRDADSYTWVAATVGANNAAGYQLATERSVMPLGGFNGSDPSPTLAEFQADVAAGKIHYFISGSGFGRSSGGSSAASEISTWVTSTFSPQTVDGATVYDLTQRAS
ncbi:MAG TPA: glycosyltransferase family 39 protein [Cellulomonas sp.]|uniref:ArnT family glycosyltransferase n=1 Tax=Cellulomonas sp. TaxID=40001 RepID=UPI002E36893B|nr:glycosyltransferase family 39 protein [Cellulomonas sp.]HEX5332583.1 glycosyltransferase family 39 protein [Cellulomonas sp.]